MLTKVAVSVLPLYISTKLSMQEQQNCSTARHTQIESSNKLDLVSMPKNILYKLVM